MSKVVKIGIMQYLKKEVSDEVDFLHSDKHQSFLKIDAIFFDWFGHYLNSTSRENAKNSRFFPFLESLGGFLTVCQLSGSLANIRSLIFWGGSLG